MTSVKTLNTASSHSIAKEGALRLDLATTSSLAQRTAQNKAKLSTISVTCPVNCFVKFPAFVCHHLHSLSCLSFTIRQVPPPSTTEVLPPSPIQAFRVIPQSTIQNSATSVYKPGLFVRVESCLWLLCLAVNGACIHLNMLVFMYTSRALDR